MAVMSAGCLDSPLDALSSVLPWPIDISAPGYARQCFG
ncbi:hypothetical protein MLPF_3093 [Mycobacterium lepromatosis]|nr:hypothetical protein MLPF_3093 [Mycobacterium lepromatosis]